MSALGLTDVKGTFKSTCVSTIDHLRNGSDTLLTLLEASVFDLLVDWTPLQEAAGLMGHHLALAIYGTGGLPTSSSPSG